MSLPVDTSIPRGNPIRNAADLAAALGAKRAGNEYRVNCWVHPDTKQHVSIADGDNGPVFHCHHGCSQGDLVEGLRRLGLWPTPESPPNERRIVATYDYTDEHGVVLFQTVRYDPKDFRQRRPDGQGGWVWNLHGVTRVPYRLPQLVNADPTKTVFLMEGEKAVDAAASRGMVATCSPMGAGKWRDEYDHWFAGRDVVIFPDNDAPGRAHAEDVARHLRPVARSVQTVELPGLPAKGDAFDWFAAGHDAAELRAFVSSPDDAHVVERDTGHKPPQLICLADVQSEAVDFLWYPYIPLRKLTMLEGDPGVGKGFIIAALATALSLGTAPPGAPPFGKAASLIISTEDGIADTIRPRLDAMGANVSMVFTLNFAPVLDECGLHDLEQVIAELCPALVALDPLVAVLGAAVDLHRSNETRPIMDALAGIAQRYGPAIIPLRHLTKGARDKAIYRGLGGIDLTAACRSVLLAGVDPEDKSKRALVHTKSNLAPMGESVGYRLDEQGFAWTGASTITAQDILAADTREATAALDDAKDFLRTALAGSAQPVKAIQAEARQCGIAERTLDRAKRELGVKAEREGKPGERGKGQWMWRAGHD